VKEERPLARAADPRVPADPGDSASDRLKLLFVSSGGLGLAPVAPGTFGTLGGVVIAWALADAQAYLLWVVAACVLLYAGGRALGRWSELRAGGKDPGFFVVDEVIGYLVTVLWIDGPSWFLLLVAFFVFRFFDIVKLPPARRFERIRGGDGILLDDVVAGLHGLLLLTAARLLLPDLPWSVGS